MDRETISRFMAMLGIIFSSPAYTDLMIYHLDVGMGDATLIVDTEKSRSLLIDSGNRSYGKKVVAPTLKDLGFSHVNYFVATHYDADHIGGFDELTEAGITFDIVYDRGEFTDRKKKTEKNNPTQYGEYVTAAANKRKTLQASCLDEQQLESYPIYLGEEIRLTIVAVGGRYLDTECKLVTENIANHKDNDLSIALVIRYKDFSYFIGGDLTGGGNGTTDMETRIAPKVGDVDVLKLNHHGSATSSNANFLRALSPEVAVISVGDGGVNRRYGLPKQRVLDRLSQLLQPPRLFLTNRGEGGSYPGQLVTNGHVVLHSNGISYAINGYIRAVDERVSLESQ